MRCTKLSQRCSFISMMIFTAGFFVVEITVGYITNSTALIADSFHMLSDVVSLLVGYFALKFSKVGTQTGHYTFGWARAEVLGALVNAVFLVALCFSIIVEALKRIVIPEDLANADLVLITGGIGLFVNIIGLFLFHQHGHSHSHGGHGHAHGSHGSHGSRITDSEVSEKPTAPVGLLQNKELQTRPICGDDEDENDKLIQQERSSMVKDVVVHSESKSDGIVKHEPPSSASLNIRGVYLHVLGDALGSVIVMISALIIKFTSGAWNKYVDPSLSIIMVMIILRTSFPLLKESSMILMQTVPTHMKIQDIQDKLIDQVPGILSVHEFHIWQLSGNKIIASAHIHCKTLLDYMRVATQVKEFFHKQGIHSTTIQPEFVEPLSRNVLECMLECEKVCSENTCCGSSMEDSSSTGPMSLKSSTTTAASLASSRQQTSRPVTASPQPQKNVPV